MYVEENRNTRFLWGNLKETDHLEDLGVDGDGIKIDLKEREWDGMGWFYVAQNWGPGGLLWRREWTFGFHSGKFFDSEVLPASGGGLLHAVSLQSSEVAPGHFQARFISFVTSRLFPAVQLPCAKVNRFLAQMNYFWIYVVLHPNLPVCLLRIFGKFDLGQGDELLLRCTAVCEG
jgi:hypothetical protein